MSLFGLFRGFFGFPERGDGRGDRFFQGMTLDDEDEDEDDGFFGARQGDTFGFGFGPGSRNFDDGFSGLFREMDELFKGIGSWEVPSGQFDLPVLEPHPYGGGQQEWSRRSPRDLMLKEPERDHPEGSGEQPDSDRRDRLTPEGPRRGPLTPYRRPWNPSNKFEEMWESLRQGETVKEDKDLDSRVNSEGLDKILKPSEPQTRSYFKSVSVSKVVLPDGSVEERRVTRDGEGNEETTVTRAQGEQSYTTVTRRDAQGKEERTEEMVNMDDSERERFTEHWEHRAGKDTPHELQTFGDSLSFLDKLLKGIFSR
ncbi:LOW QUALITY PROTEIN: HCLS1-associated protein X-1 [Stegostoma tigrinum]|uniref:LOW QUALITY PROTEIN: HCLS1-associated protein X-1 n=1 Tax=Stegostoma tigrinum TaxID=3053191 RepID=UPI00286FEEBB|nr:LOW QUALITY PROTEIN: HCLS1-associated protein X-1 [Stegostoma tigrinum]